MQTGTFRSHIHPVKTLWPFRSCPLAGIEAGQYCARPHGTDVAINAAKNDDVSMRKICASKLDCDAVWQWQRQWHRVIVLDVPLTAFHDCAPIEKSIQIQHSPNQTDRVAAVAHQPLPLDRQHSEEFR